MTHRTSFPKEKIKVLLLEGIHPAAEERFREADYLDIERGRSALPEDQLLELIPGVHILGIRSKTELSARVLAAAPQLLAVGCFCIGTDQVELDAAARRGVAVFNAPFSNTRSVAELAIAEVVMLARRAAQRSMEMHAGRWDKTSRGCVEVRHKTIGIVGYGHIGPQVGLLAESFGMKVVFHDTAKRLPLGNARQAANLEEVLKAADFVTLHVPETPLTRNMIGRAQIAQMARGSFLLNLSRGSVLDLGALKAAILDGHLAGAAVDVYPDEPESSGQPFLSELQGLPNLILTPHIGGSTEEAQHNIGLEVSEALVRYVDTGSSTGCVNLPQVDLPILQDSHRVLNIHKDVPGVLGSINGLIAGMGINIQSQCYNTRDGIGYLIMDVERGISSTIKSKIDALESNIRTRLLF
jgi:D-3-phosphoglycerate dehydrogenase / 2-oxoglutarate reductase